MKVFDKTKAHGWGMLGFCARTAAVALVAMAFAFVGCKQHAGGGEPPLPAPVPKKTVVPEDDVMGGTTRHTYRFFVGSDLLGGITTSENEFSKILEKVNPVYETKNFEGWTANGEFVVPGMTFDKDTNFIAQYKLENPYKNSISMSDLTDYAWYSQTRGEFLVFLTDQMMPGVYTAVSFKAAEEDFFEVKITLSRYKTLMNKTSKTAAEDEEFRKLTGDSPADWWGFGEKMTFEESTTGSALWHMSFATQETFTCQMNKQGTSLYDKNGNVLYGRIKF